MPRLLFIGRGACRPSLIILTRSNFSRVQISSGSLDEGLSLIQHDRVDFVLADVDGSGLRAIDRLKHVSTGHPAVRFAVISHSDSSEFIISCLATGIHGFILKHQSDKDIIAAIKQILSGRIYVPWPSSEGNASAPGISQGRCVASDILKLTPRQHQVLRLLSLGMSNKEIARALRIAESTTKIHTSLLMRALGVRNRTEGAFQAGRLLSTIEQPSVDAVPPSY